MNSPLAAGVAALPPPVIDIEASGFGHGSYPIEVGFVLPDGQAWCSLIRPEADWQHWDDAAASMHGITREQLWCHGRSPATVCDTLNQRLRGLTIYSDAWAHDYTWLGRLFDVADRVPAFKLENLRALLTEADAARWHEVKSQVAARMGLARHRASADARLLQQTLAAVKQVAA
ncbi:MAG: hypothetical protein ACK4MG_06500 [Aquabacterium sp.]